MSAHKKLGSRELSQHCDGGSRLEWGIRQGDLAHLLFTFLDLRTYETSKMMWRTEASSAICSKQGQEGPVLLQVRGGEAGPCGKEQHRESKPCLCQSFADGLLGPDHCRKGTPLLEFRD